MKNENMMSEPVVVDSEGVTSENGQQDVEEIIPEYAVDEEKERDARQGPRVKVTKWFPE